MRTNHNIVNPNHDPILRAKERLDPEFELEEAEWEDYLREQQENVQLDAIDLLRQLAHQHRTVTNELL